MKSFGILGILFVLLLALPTKAETPFVIESAWVVANNEWLELLNDSSVIGGASLSFPDAIPANAYWRGATVTDGNTVGTIIILPVNEGHTLSGIQGFILRAKLRTNAIISAAFPNGFHVIQSGEMAILYSPELSQNDIDAFELLRPYFEDLGERAHFGFIQYYPERTLLPTLPPEQEDESEFVKKVRKRAATDYRDGQYVGTTDSIYVGLHQTNDDYKIVYEVQNIADTPVSDDTKSQPFNLDGFINTVAPFNAALRVPFDRDFIERTFIKIKFGIGVIPPNERKDDETFSTMLSVSVESELKEEDDYHLIRNGNVGVFYWKQPENRPEEEGIPSKEEFERIRKELAHGVLTFFSNVYQSLLSLNWSQPIDVAVSLEDQVLYLACIYPPTETPIDWLLGIQFAQNLFDHLEQLKPSDDPTPTEWFSLPEIQEASENIAGLPCYWMNFSHEGEGILAVYVREPGVFYAAVFYSDNADEDTEEQYEATQRRLAEKIEASRRTVAEKMPPPLTVLRSNRDGFKLHTDYETLERGYRVSIYIADDSIENVLALAHAWNINPLQMLPFWHTQ